MTAERADGVASELPALVRVHLEAAGGRLEPHRTDAARVVLKLPRHAEALAGAILKLTGTPPEYGSKRIVLDLAKSGMARVRSDRDLQARLMALDPAFAERAEAVRALVGRSPGLPPALATALVELGGTCLPSLDRGGRSLPPLPPDLPTYGRERDGFMHCDGPLAEARRLLLRVQVGGPSLLDAAQAAADAVVGPSGVLAALVGVEAAGHTLVAAVSQVRDGGYDKDLEDQDQPGWAELARWASTLPRYETGDWLQQHFPAGTHAVTNLTRGADGWLGKLQPFQTVTTAAEVLPLVVRKLDLLADIGQGISRLARDGLRALAQARFDDETTTACAAALDVSRKFGTGLAIVTALRAEQLRAFLAGAG